MVGRNEKGVILAPNRPINIPGNAQWIAGQGAGSWFTISEVTPNTIYSISRFSPNGEMEFKANFKLEGQLEFCVDCVYAFTYLSHYKQCKILQHSQEFVFTNIK